MVAVPSWRRCLWRPGHRVQQLDAALVEDAFEHRLLRQIEAVGVIEAGGQEGQRVEAEDRVLVDQRAHQDLAHLRLAGFDRAHDLRHAEQRAVGMHHDPQLALGLELDVLGQLLQRDGMRIADRVAGRHVPLGLSLRNAGDGATQQASGKGSDEAHGFSSRLPCRPADAGARGLKS